MTRPGLYIAVVLLVVAGAFGSLWVYTADARVAFLDEDYGQWAAKLQLIRSCQVGTVAILGDSRASAAYIPHLLGLPAKNLALSGATPVETYYEARDIFKCPTPPDTVVLSFSAAQFEVIDWLWAHAARFGQLSFDDLQDIARMDQKMKTGDIYHGAFGAEPPPVIKNWLYAWHFPPYDFGSLIAARLGMRLGENQAIEEATLAADGQHVIGTPRSCATSPGWEAEQTSFTPNPLIMAYFDRLMSLLDSHSARVIMTSPPYSRMTMDKLNPEYVRQYRQFMSDLLHRYPNIRMSGPLFPVMDDCAFGDQHHLHQAGAELFSRHISKELAASMVD